MTQHQQKVLVGCGIFVGFRGYKEHYHLSLDQIKTGVFPSNHPSHPGLDWCGIDHFPSDKVEKLGLETSHVRNVDEGLGRFPILSDGKKGDISNDFGGALLRLKNKIPDSKKNLRCIYRRVSANKKRYLPDSRIGEHKIRELIQLAYKHMGIPNWKTLKSHALRGLFINTLANDESVNITEVMAAARHRSTAASAAYQTRSSKSECNRLKALFKRKADTAIEHEENDFKNVKVKVDNEYYEENNNKMNVVEEISDDEEYTKESTEKKGYSIYTQAAADRLEYNVERVEKKW